MSSLDVVVAQPTRPAWLSSAHLATAALALTLALLDFLLQPYAPAPLLAALPALGLALGYWRAPRARPAAPPAAVPRAPAPTVVAFAPPLPVEAPPAEIVPEAIDEATLTAMIEDLASLDIFNGILSRQLRSVIAITDEAATAISTSVSSADTQISELIQVFERSKSDDKVGEAVRNIETQISGCKELVGEFSQRQRGAADDSAMQRNRIVAETASVLESLEGVDEIALQTTILSMNVSIEAARAGAAGKGFMVIAREIRELASRAKSISADARARIEALTQSVHVDLEGEAKRRDALERESFQSLSAHIAAFSDNVDTILRHERETFAKAEAAGGEIGAAVMEALSRIQFQDIVRQQLQQLESLTALVRDHLVGFGVALGERGAREIGASLAQKLEEQFSAYVMDGQRNAHLAATGQAAQKAALPLIEMF